MDPCAEQSLEDLGASGLFELSRVCSSRLLYCVLSLCSPSNGFLFLFQVLVRMRALQDKCVVNEGEICRFCKCQEIKNKERDQYKKVVRTLNKELTDTKAKLKEKSRLREEAEKAKTYLTMELEAFR